jgi:hypothetical protein
VANDSPMSTPDLSPIDDIQRQAAVMGTVRALSEDIGPRQAGSEGERRAAEWLAEQFRRLGWEVEVDVFPAAGTFMAVYGPLTALAALSYVGAWWWPWVGVAGGLFGGLMLTVENLPLQAFSRLVKFRRSRNVLARRAPAGDAEQDIVVMAHIDSAITTDVRNMKLVRMLFIAIIVSCLGVAGLSLAAAVGVARSVLIIGAPCAVHLLICTGIMVHQGLCSPVVAGAGDNASGVAAMLQTARELPALQRSTVWLVGTGSEECGLMGALRLLDRQRFDRHRTWFINVDTVSGGPLHSAAVEGMLFPLRADESLCRIATEEGEAMDSPVAPEVLQAMSSDGCVPLVRGYRAVSIGGTDPHWHQPEDIADNVSAEVVAQAAVLLRRMIERLDAS